MRLSLVTLSSKLTLYWTVLFSAMSIWEGARANTSAMTSLLTRPETTQWLTDSLPKKLRTLALYEMCRSINHSPHQRSFIKSCKFFFTPFIRTGNLNHGGVVSSCVYWASVSLFLPCLQAITQLDVREHSLGNLVHLFVPLKRPLIRQCRKTPLQPVRENDPPWFYWTSSWQSGRESH